MCNYQIRGFELAVVQPVRSGFIEASRGTFSKPDAAFQKTSECNTHRAKIAQKQKIKQQ